MQRRTTIIFCPLSEQIHSTEPVKRYSSVVFPAMDELPIERWFNFTSDSQMKVTSRHATKIGGNRTMVVWGLPEGLRESYSLANFIFVTQVRYVVSPGINRVKFHISKGISISWEKWRQEVFELHGQINLDLIKYVITLWMQRHSWPFHCFHQC